MRGRVFRAWAVCCAALCGPSLWGQPSRAGEASMKERILAIEDSAMEEWRQGNPMRWVEISADDVVYVDPALAAPVVGKAAYRAYLEPLVGKVHYDGSEYVSPRVAVYGDLAVLTYNYHSLRKDSAGQSRRNSFWNTTEVYRQTGGEWRIVHTHWSFIGHGLPESLEMTIPVLAKEEPLSGAAAEIMRLERGALERWRKGDPTGVLERSAEEVTHFDDDTPTRLDGLVELKKKHEKVAGKVRYDAMEFVRPRFWVGTDAVVLFYQLLSTTLDPDGTVRARTPWNCTEVYAKTPAGWRVVHSHWSLVRGARADGGV